MQAAGCGAPIGTRRHSHLPRRRHRPNIVRTDPGSDAARSQAGRDDERETPRSLSAESSTSCRTTSTSCQCDGDMQRAPVGPLPVRAARLLESPGPSPQPCLLSTWSEESYPPRATTTSRRNSGTLALPVKFTSRSSCTTLPSRAHRGERSRTWPLASIDTHQQYTSPVPGPHWRILLYLALELPRVPHVVGVEGRDELARCQRNGRVSCRRDSKVGWVTSRTRPSASARRATMAPVSSVEPSSTTISSSRECVWPNAERQATSMWAAALNAATTTDTRGSTSEDIRQCSTAKQ